MLVKPNGFLYHPYRQPHSLLFWLYALVGEWNKRRTLHIRWWKRSSKFLVCMEQELRTIVNKLDQHTALQPLSPRQNQEHRHPTVSCVSVRIHSQRSSIIITWQACTSIPFVTTATCRFGGRATSSVFCHNLRGRRTFVHKGVGVYRQAKYRFSHRRRRGTSHSPMNWASMDARLNCGF